ncbi:peptidylprolyl isomerase [Flavihumibacter sp. R14]|nr:peptidylprolyl isomerase [Flavihumibacter soli]
MKQFLLAFLMLVTALGACKKDPGISAEEQLAADELRIKEFITANNIPAIRHQSGLYYQIIEPGTGTLVYGANTSITAKYTLRLLNGNTIPQPTAPIDFNLGGVILGWQIGIPLIQKGGKIRLFVPSGYAYGAQAQNGIPSNSILDFDVELVDAQN